MSDQEIPTSGRDRNDKPSEELFDADFLPDADGDFLGELDRVLTTDDEEHGPETGLADVEEALESMDLDVEPESTEQDAWTESASIPAPEARMCLEPEVPPAPNTVDRLQALREHRRPVPAPEETTTGAPERIPPVAAVVRSPAAKDRAVTGSASAVASKPAGTGGHRPAPMPGNDRTPTITRQPATAVDTATPRPAAPPPPTLGSRPGTPLLWLVVLGLLAVLGFGTGAVGIWLQLDTDTHLAWMEKRLAEVSGAERDSREAAKAERLRALESEIAALQAVQDKFGPTLVQRLVQENERLRRDLARLESTLAELYGGLETVQVKLAEIERRPNGVQRSTDAATATPAGNSVASPQKGGWAVNLMSFRRQSVAEKEAARLRDDGIPVTLQSVERKGRTWYRLRVVGFADVAQAKAFAKKIRTRRELSSAWVGRN